MDCPAPYGDVTELNTCRDLMDAVGREMLTRIVQGHLNPPGASAAVYEVNGDYATILVASDYCRFLDCASRRLCQTQDNAAALASGKWHCHESCWTQAAKVSIETLTPFDLRLCLGGINIYAVPIISKSRVIGAISCGYGTPPGDEKTLREIARRYHVDIGELRRIAEQHKPVPDIVAQVAKQQMETAAQMIAAIYERRQAEEALKRVSHQYQLILNSVTEGIYGIDLEGNTTFVNPAAEIMTGFLAGELIGRHQHDLLHCKKADGTPYPREECKAYAAIMDGNVHHVTGELFWKKDGTSFPVEYVSAPLREQDELVGAVIVFKDVTERNLAEERIRRKAARAKALAELSHALAGAVGDYQAVLEAVARHMSALIGDPYVIHLQSNDGRWFNPVVVHHPDPETLAFMRDFLAAVPVDAEANRGLFGRVLATGQPVLIPVLSLEQARVITKPEYWPCLEQISIPGVLAVPLRAQGRVIGTLSIVRPALERPHAVDDQAFWQNLADRVALAIANSRLHRENMHQLETISALYTSAQKLAQSLDLQELAGDIARTCVEVFGARLAWLGHAEADGRVSLLAQFPPESEYPLTSDVRWDDSPFGQGPVGWAICSGSPVIATDVANDPHFEPWRALALAEGFCTSAAFPFISRGRPFGTLNLYSDQPGFFTPERVEFLQAYAHQAAAALEKARLFEEVGRRLEELRSSEERFFKAFHASPAMMSIKTLDKETYVEVNDSFEKTTGYKRAEIIGNTAFDLQFYIDQESRYKIVRLLETNGSYRNIEIAFKIKTGEQHIGLSSAEVIDFNGGKCILSVLHDVTELKKYEKEMARLQRMNTIAQMAAGIGHEVRNPMTVTRGFLQLLSGKPECTKYAHYFQLMIDELDRANSIITQLFSLADNKSAQLVQADLNRIITSLFPLINANALESDKTIELLLDNIPDLLLNEGEMRQLILNLVRNGLEAMQPGQCVTIKTILDGDHVVLSVCDQGSGIAPEILDKLGTPFFTTKSQGTGLGLAICYNIAHRHGATIEINTGFSGTNFNVTFRHRSISDQGIPPS